MFLSPFKLLIRSLIKTLNIAIFVVYLTTINIICQMAVGFAGSAASLPKSAIPSDHQWFALLNKLKPNTPGKFLSNDVLGKDISFVAMKDEHILFTVLPPKPKNGAGNHSTDCYDIPLKLNPLKYEVKYYAISTIETSKPSYAGARVGLHYDPLIPITQNCGTSQWILVDLHILAVPQNEAGTYLGRIGNLSLKVRLVPDTLPKVPSVPLYAELTTWFLLLGHYGKWHEGEDRLANQYQTAMLANRIFPIKNWLKPSVDTSYEEVVSQPLAQYFDQKNKMHHPLLSVPFPLPPQTGEGWKKYHAETSQRLKLLSTEQRSFFYLWDEPEQKHKMIIQNLIKEMRQSGSEAAILVTTPLDEKYLSNVNIFAPVMDQFETPGFPDSAAYSRWINAKAESTTNQNESSSTRRRELWLYTSCMSHGCGNDVSSGTPDWVIERDDAYILIQPWIALKYGARALLYYSVNNFYQYNADALNDKRRNVWLTQWDFTGNGDGNLFYPGMPWEQMPAQRKAKDSASNEYQLPPSFAKSSAFVEHGPIESIRLKIWLQASQDADFFEYCKRIKPAVAEKILNEMVQNPRHWQHDLNTLHHWRSQCL